MSDGIVTGALVAFDVCAVVWAVVAGRRARARGTERLRRLEALCAPLEPKDEDQGPLQLLRLHWSCSQCGEHGDAIPALPPSRWHRHFRLER